MLPKRPVSCLFVGLVPVGLGVLLLVLAGYAVKFLLPSDVTQVQTESSPVDAIESEDEVARVSLLPQEIASSTTLLVATVSSSAAKERVFSLDAFGEKKEEDASEGFRPEQWKTEGIVLTPPEESVTSSPWRVTGPRWNVPLRTPGGAKWQDPVIVGMFSSGRLAIVAYRTQRALLSVDRSGDIQVVDVLDDELAPLAVQGTSAWFVHTTQDTEARLEALPQGPSRLVRISEQGVRVTIAEDPGSILELIPSPNPATIAYLSSDGSLVIVSGEDIRSDIKGWRPQLWLDDRYLLVSRNGALAWVDRMRPKELRGYAEFTDFIRGVTRSTSSSRSMLK